MLILALETSTDAASCALWAGGQVLGRDCPAAANSSATLLPAVAALLAEAGVSLSQLTGIAFGAGPGSFTGLRVACGVAQGLAFAHDLPLAPVSTLAAVAHLSGEAHVLAVLDARMQEVYFAAFTREAARESGYPVLVGEIGVAPPDRVPPPPGADWVICGNALLAYPALGERLGTAFRQRSELLPTAAAVAILGAHEFAQGRGLPAEQAAPLYIRDKVALTVAERLGAGGKA